MDKESERKWGKQVLSTLAENLKPFGFVRTKPTWFVRLKGNVAEFIHLHKFTFGPQFRAHAGIRILNDPSESIALNGPDSDRIRNPLYFLSNARKYTFKYGESEQSTQECAGEIVKFVTKEAGRWFRKRNTDEKLVNLRSSSPSDTPIQVLHQSVDHANVKKSKELLGVK